MGSDGEFVNAESDEEWCEIKITGHFSADSSPDAVVFGCLGGHVNEANDCWVCRFVEV